MKMLVITGCLGFIGSHVTRDCLAKGYKVYGVDKKTYASNEVLLEEFSNNENFFFSCKDICDMKILPDCDFVINTAAETHVGNSIIDSAEFTRTNILGVQNLLELIRKKPSNIAQKPILLQFSTDEVYGDIISGSHTELDPLNPSNPYSSSKASADLMIKAWARTYGIEYIIVRPTNNYGRYQYPEKLIPLSVKLLKRGKKIRLHNQGETTRNWLHVEDTSQAILKIMEHDVKNEIFNIAGSFEQKNIDAVKKIVSAFDTSVHWKSCVDLDYKRAGQDVRYSLDDSRLRKLGWSPRKSFDVEIEKIVEFYKNYFIW